ncbi:MAG: RNA methyltransferase [Lentimicrobiaceae bacterium]|nr:RNA methyltransferase [Lentimicrobiaceae bacterium]
MITKNDIKVIQSLKQTKFRKENKMFLVEGNKLIDELLSSDFKTENILVTETWIEKFTEMANRLPHYDIISQKQMEQVSSMVTPPGIIATAHTPSYKINPEDTKNEFIIALDGINDPGNLGTIIRTADWFGINKIVCSTDCADAWQTKTIQSTMGSIFRIKVMETDLREFLININKSTDAACHVPTRKTPIYGALMEGENIFTKKIEKKNGVIIIGSESHGIRKDILPLVTSPIHIPRGNGSKTESLNASVAAAIIISAVSYGR